MIGNDGILWRISDVISVSSDKNGCASSVGVLVFLF